ncbi:MAG: glycosyltransferase family 2 protein [Acidobacteria bacterium]|nr:glycosyltransferase family 2 protein [Acidobacteriota bacterium]
MRAGHVLVSVVIPAYNARETLELCLGNLMESQPSPPYECLVVDDGSTDGSAEIAARYGARVLSTGGRKGPAYARNIGARAAAGNVLLFLDADVTVHPDTVELVRSAFAADPKLDALMGSYDDAPGTEDFLSQYRNLMHCFTHQTSRREACTFWSGCGAIRKDLFLEHGGFDEEFGRPAIEDIELGYRLQQAGRKLMLDREIQVKHLKRWTFLNLLKTDVLDRGIPWTELILRDQRMPNDLNLQLWTV